MQMQNYQCEKQETGKMEIAMSYVPWQHFGKIYDDLMVAFQNGTVFPQLNKPFMGRKV